MTVVGLDSILDEVVAGIETSSDDDAVGLLLGLRADELAEATNVGFGILEVSLCLLCRDLLLQRAGFLGLLLGLGLQRAGFLGLASLFRLLLGDFVVLLDAVLGFVLFGLSGVVDSALLCRMFLRCSSRCEDGFDGVKLVTGLDLGQLLKNFRAVAHVLFDKLFHSV